MTDGDGIEIKIGDYLSFKQGVEITGKVVGFRQGYVLVDYNDPFTDEPKQTGVEPKRSWHE